MADAIVDISKTGRSLRTNHLQEIAEVMAVEAVLIKRPGLNLADKRVQEFLSRLIIC